MSKYRRVVYLWDKRGEMCPKFWIGAVVQMNCEKKTATLLSKDGYEAYAYTKRNTLMERLKEKVDCFILSMFF